MVLIICILSVVYALFICWCIAGWMRLPEISSLPASVGSLYVSVIIPARNEEDNMLACLEDFPLQDYPANFFELIVINDHSTDHTVSLVKKFIEANPGIKTKL